MRESVRCAVVSLGCPKNLVDSEHILGWLAESGFELTTNLKEAEVVVVNTCGFLQAAVDESLAHLRKLARLKRKGRCRLLIAAGCLVSRFPELVQKEVHEVDACLGVRELDRIPLIVAERLNMKLRRREVVAEPPYAPRIISTPPWYAYLKIAEGCDRTCSFCTIPSIRGKQKSRPMDELEAEARELVEQGVKELILVAQDTTRYGADLYGKPMLPQLIRRLARLDGLKWLRLLYCYPTAVSEQLIEAMAESDRVARYVDIPLQHSHPEILRLMRRGGDAESYARSIERLRAAMPDIAIRTTFIVGFPGETDKHFEHLLEFVKVMKFDRLGVFTFSSEPGTPAYDLPNKVPPHVANERRHILLSIQREISLKRNRSLVGKVLEVVVERWDERTNTFEARSQYEAPEIDGVIKVKGRELEGSGQNKVFSPDKLLGKFVEVKVVKALPYDLLADFTVERRRGDELHSAIGANGRIRS